MTVLVGRNNKENDILTLKTAGNKDLWLHTKDIPGSHVIVQCGGAQPDEAAIFEAAAIAAYHSKARGSENVPVDYVPVKYVKNRQAPNPAWSFSPITVRYGSIPSCRNQMIKA